MNAGLHEIEDSAKLMRACIHASKIPATPVGGSNQ